MLYLDNPISYYIIEDKNNFPTLDKINEEFEIILNEMFQECKQRVSFSIETQIEGKISSQIIDRGIITSIVLSNKIKFYDQEIEIKPFDIFVEKIPIHKIYSAINEIMTISNKYDRYFRKNR